MILFFISLSGPYLFLFGGITFLLQKEIWVIDHEFMEVVPFALAIAFIVKRFGPKVSSTMDARAEVITFDSF